MVRTTIHPRKRQTKTCSAFNLKPTRSHRRLSFKRRGGGGLPSARFGGGGSFRSQTHRRRPQVTLAQWRRRRRCCAVFPEPGGTKPDRASPVVGGKKPGFIQDGVKRRTLGRHHSQASLTLNAGWNDPTHLIRTNGVAHPDAGPLARQQGINKPYKSLPAHLTSVLACVNFGQADIKIGSVLSLSFWPPGLPADSHSRRPPLKTSADLTSAGPVVGQELKLP